MRRVSVWPLLLLLLLLPQPSGSLTSDPEEEVEEMEEMEDVRVEVIVSSSPCSATCGLGVKTQTLCFLKEGNTGMEEGEKRMDGGIEEEEEEVTRECRDRKVKCLESPQCGLRTVTVTTGERLEIDCLGEVMEAMGRYSWRVSWRLARGIISSDDSLFARWEAPQLDRVVLDPVREEDAGTYRCDVQDAALRRVKRAYWGVRVLPRGVLDLDYDSSLALWHRTGNHQNQTVVSGQQLRYRILCIMVLTSVCLSGAVAGSTLLGLSWLLMKRGRRRRRRADKAEGGGGGGGGTQGSIVVLMTDTEGEEE
ncbi:transmembrane protein 81 [Centroberyx affinis]|uniref:transmembrane protein 81 n=1 Tax=Centroberyx affinis TaxID=166261 RepID=UPI003A5C3AC6